MTRNIIINGPSKFDLCLAFFDNPREERRPATFTIAESTIATGKIRVDVVINSISWKGGSGESWNFEGYAKIWIGQNSSENYPNVKGYFSTMTRKGFIDIDAEKSIVWKNL